MTPLELTRKLLSFNTINPPGNERQMARFIGKLLEAGGFMVQLIDFAEQRTNIIARKIFDGDKPPLCFSGHMDTVPLGLAEWRHDPYSGELDGDRVYGRGSSDMKGGLAAMILAGLRIAAATGGASGVQLVLTAGEENGCQGAEFLAGRKHDLGPAGALIVGEPTANYPMLGHKGAFWLEAQTAGVSAHGSMPDQGVNAIYAAARAIARLAHFEFKGAAHPLLGSPTLNVGTFSGGININSVPDRATFTIDIRTVPPQSGERLLSELTNYLGKEVRLKVLTNQNAVASNPQDPWVQEVFSLLQTHTGEHPVPRGVTYFTDASALAAAFEYPPTIILGPGQPDMAHKTDEFCLVSKIETAADVYFDIAKRWCGI